MDINITQLAHDLVQQLFTSTALYAALKETGKGASSEIGKMLISSVTSQTKALLEKLWPKIGSRPEVLEAIKDLGRKPGDQRVQSALELQLEKLLGEDMEWANEVAQLWKEVRAVSAENTSLAIGGDVTGSTIIVGNHNQVK
jgi:hypothetical protein